MMRDQEVLRSITEWRNRTSLELPRRMLDVETYAEKVEQFRSYLGGHDEEMRLCEEYLQIALKKHGEKAGEGCLGFSFIKTLATTGSDAEHQALPWLTRQIDIAFDISLHMVDCLYMFVERLPQIKQPLRQHVADGLIRHTTADPLYLGCVLDSDNPYTLYRLIRFGAKALIYNTAEEWRESFPEFIRAAEKSSDRVVPNLALLLIRDMLERVGTMDADQQRYKLDIDYAGPLIPSQHDREWLVELFLKYAARSNPKPKTAERIRAVESDLRAYANMEIGVAAATDANGAENGEPAPASEPSGEQASESPNVSEDV